PDNKDKKVDPSPVSNPAQAPAPSASLTAAPAIAKPSELEEKQVAPPPKEVPQLPAKILENEFIKVTISPNKGEIESIVLKKFLNADKKNNVTFDNSGQEPGALAVFGKQAWQLLNIKDAEQSSSKTYSVTREFALPKGERFILTQTWQIEKDYRIHYEIRIKNPGNAPIVIEELSVSVGWLPPTLHLSGDKIMGETHAIDVFTLENNYVYFDAASKQETFNAPQDNPLKWLGLSNKYFARILMPDRPFRHGNTKERIELTAPDKNGGIEKYFSANASGRLEESATINPDSEFVCKINYFSGPKELGLLKELDESAAGSMHINWLPAWVPGASLMEWLGQLMMKGLLYLKKICGDYGLSIIALTIIVRLIFWPITQKANTSMRKMQKIQPMVQGLREKHKGDPAQLNAKIMELYRQEKVNPFSGCLPIFLQIPVFIALYSALNSAVELRQVPFLWASDLSRPDVVGPLFFGFGLHPLIIAMTGLMLVQQKLQPSPGDPMQQKIMMLMPLVMLVMLYDLPSGLTLYWTVSQIISIIQIQINKAMAQKEERQGAVA
ncbi:MAG: hypothetical protein A2X49_01880, partial [Lentisphaerae bacterium GWF2_52_8]